MQGAEVNQHSGNKAHQDNTFPLTEKGKTKPSTEVGNATSSSTPELQQAAFGSALILCPAPQ